MKKIILHCGMPKTGSSALQVQLSRSRDVLLKYGYDYIKKGQFNLGTQGKISSGNGVELARAFLPPSHPASLYGRRGRLVEEFREAIREVEGHVILSSEFFSAIPNHLKEDLVSSLFDLGQVQLVFFTREQTSALASSYIQQVKRHGLTQFPDEYFSAWDGYKMPMMYFSYFNSISQISSQLEVIAKPYELSKDHPSGLMGLFLDLLGADIPKDELTADVHTNLSPSPKEIRLMIEVNKHNPRMQFSDMLVESSYRAGRTHIHSHHSILPPEFQKEARVFFRTENEKFFEKISKSENIYMQSDQGEEFTDLRQVHFEARDVIDILSGILVNIDRRLSLLEDKV